MGFFMEYSMSGEELDAVVVDSQPNEEETKKDRFGLLSRILRCLRNTVSGIIVPSEESLKETVLARHKIFVSVPEWRGGHNDESEILRRCYGDAMETAMQKGCHSIAFPILGIERQGYPVDQAIDIAFETLHEYSLKNDADIHLMPGDYFLRPQMAQRRNQMPDFLAYVQSHYEEPVKYSVSLRETPDKAESANIDKKDLVEDLEKSLPQKKKGELFCEYLQGLLARTGKRKVEVYKAANLDRRIFSKIQKEPNSIPSKRTVLALAVAMQLSLDETKAFLEQAGFALSPSVRSDVIVEYFIKKGNYDIFLINEVLYSYGESLLGSISWEERMF